MPQKRLEVAGGGWVFGTGPYNLCRAKVSGSGPNLPNRIRVFFWHISRFTVPTYWAIIVGSDGTGGSVSNIRQQLGTDDLTGNLGTIGMCLADAHLWDTLSLVNASEIDITDEQTIWSQTLPAGTQNAALFTIVAAIVEFDVDPGATLTVRSAISLSPGKFGDYDTALALPSSNWPPHTGTHVRGLWMASEINLNLLGGFPYDCNPFPPPPKFAENDFCENGDLEHSYFSEVNSLADKLVGFPTDGNPAAYGANLNYNGVYTNSHANTNGRLYLGIRSRNIGAKYFGAGAITLPQPATRRKLRPIPYAYTATPPDPPNAGENLRGYDLTAELPMGYIAAPPLMAPAPFKIRIANGGGWGTPANFIIAREVIWVEPNQQPPQKEIEVK